tara:strand:- start:213 stop:443 length:231 start_codon:yes stop_codon:yes gene_type:complete
MNSSSKIKLINNILTELNKKNIKKVKNIDLIKDLSFDSLDILDFFYLLEKKLKKKIISKPHDIIKFTNLKNLLKQL